MFIELSDNLLHVFIAGFLGGLLVYLATRWILGNRADVLPGGALAGSVLFSPIWLMLISALLGHVAGVFVMRKLRPLATN